MAEYSGKIRLWATDTRRTGILADADGTGEIGLEAAEIGRRLGARFTLKVIQNRICDARYQVFGCGYSMAACAVAADLAVGQTLGESRGLDADCLEAALDGLPEERRYCAELAARALQAAVQSALTGGTVRTALPQDKAHAPRVTSNHPVYDLLMPSRSPAAISDADRHLLACPLSVATEEPWETAAALGLDAKALNALLSLVFPGVDRAALAELAPPVTASPPECNTELLTLLLPHVPTDRGFMQQMISSWLVRILATRSALPGHLWVAMGLTERPQLSAAIGRHLPSLAAANRGNMRWKRFLFKQLCEQKGGTLCLAPNCGVCSDYHLCFADEQYTSHPVAVDGK
ncbi:MAG: nitrogen fixation protein NifQ [Desulfuromonadales bacterium]|nr:nitrogen fixation protein NifQ [Desulfuromonadales bacterium]